MIKSTGARWCRARRRAGLLAATTGLALLSAACGGSPSATGSSTSPAPVGSGGSPSALAFSRCMRTHGVTKFPDPPASFQGKFPGSSPQQLGVSMSRLQAATSSCQRLLPVLPGQAPLTVQEQHDYMKAAACMRSHGITVFPDPVFSSGHVSFPLPPGGVATGSPQFTQARQICQRLIPAGLPYSGSESGG
jgi:hypothetical protein